MAFLRFCIFALLHQSDIQYRILIIRPWDIRWCTTASQPNRLLVNVCAPLHLCCMGVSLTWRLTPPQKNPPPWCHGWHVARYTHTTLCLTFFLFSHTLLCSSHPFTHQRMSAALLFFFRKIFFFFLMECVWGETEIMRRIWDQDSSSRDPVVVITIYNSKGIAFDKPETLKNKQTAIRQYIIFEILLKTIFIDTKFVGFTRLRWKWKCTRNFRLDQNKQILK